jgi:hypothetical protein
MMYLSGIVREELIKKIENLRQDRQAEDITRGLLNIHEAGLPTTLRSRSDI